MDLTIERSFNLFTALPKELRLQIWRATLPARTLELQVQLPPPADGGQDIPPPNKPISRHHLPVAFQICQESRDEAFSQYHRISSPGGSYIGSRKAAVDYYCPQLDTLFVAQSLYALSAAREPTVYTADASAAMGKPRLFVLDFLAANNPEAAKIQSLAVQWSDMHFKEAEPLLKAIEPFTALRELIIVFYDRNNKIGHSDFEKSRGTATIKLFEVGEGVVNSRFVARMLDEFVKLTTRLNLDLRELESKASAEGSTRGRKVPELKIMLAKIDLPANRWTSAIMAGVR